MAALLPVLAATACGGGSAEQAPAARPTWVKVGTQPVGVAADPDGTVWVVNAGDSSLSHVVGTGAHREPDVGDTPLRVSVDDAALWVTSFRDGRLLRIDPGTLKITGSVSVGAGAEGVASGLGSVWVVAQDAGRLVQVRPSDLHVVRRIDIGDGARLVTTDDAHVWVSQFGEGTVLRIEPRTGKVTRSGAVCPHPQGLRATGDRVWVSCTSTDKVVALDPETLRVVATVDVPGQPDPVVAAGRRILVVAEDGPTVYELDPTDGHVTTKHRLGKAAPLDDEANVDAAVTKDDTLWVSSYREDRVYHRSLS